MQYYLNTHKDLNRKRELSELLNEFLNYNLIFSQYFVTYGLDNL